MIKIILMETIIFVFLGVISNNYLPFLFSNKKILIINMIIWGLIIICSILLNLSYFLYFISLALVGILAVAIAILKTTDIMLNNVIFWLLFGIYSISIVGIIITKYFAYKSFFDQGQLGDKGKLGDIGKSFNKNEEYLLEIIPAKCYKIIVNNIDDLLVKISKENNRDYDEHGYLFKNMYIKKLIKNKCYSKQFLDRIYGITRTSDACHSYTIETECKANTDCHWDTTNNKCRQNGEMECRLGSCPEDHPYLERYDTNHGNVCRITKGNKDTPECPAGCKYQGTEPYCYYEQLGKKIPCINRRYCYDKDNIRVTSNKCQSNADCNDSGFRYFKSDTDIQLNMNTEIKNLQNEVTIWILEILRNSKEDDEKLLKKLGGNSDYYPLKNILNDPPKKSTKISEYHQYLNTEYVNQKMKYNDYDYTLDLGTNYQRYNNDLGWRFLGDYFFTESYWGEGTARQYLVKNKKINPICFINTYYNSEEVGNTGLYTNKDYYIEYHSCSQDQKNYVFKNTSTFVEKTQSAPSDNSDHMIINFKKADTGYYIINKGEGGLEVDTNKFLKSTSEQGNIFEIVKHSNTSFKIKSKTGTGYNSLYVTNATKEITFKQGDGTPLTFIPVKY